MTTVQTRYVSRKNTMFKVEKILLTKLGP